MNVPSVVSRAFDLLFPRTCLICARPIAQGALCFRCLPEAAPLEQQLDTWKELPFGSLFSMWSYQHSARRFITAMKYRPSIRLARIAGTELSRCFLLAAPQRHVDLIVPVPSSRSSFRSRLFNPIVPSAEALAASLAVPWTTCALRHCGYRAPQASLSRTRRLSNVRQAFQACRKTVDGKHILLVDDVVTTGSTLTAAAQALRAAGAIGVQAITLAHVATWTDNIQLLARRYRG